MTRTAAAAIVAVLAFTSAADAQSLYDRRTGKYLGELGGSPYSPDSTANPYGRYGSRYSPDSINNPYGRYGSEYSPDSPNNPYATNPPAIYDNDGYGSGDPWNRNWTD